MRNLGFLEKFIYFFEHPSVFPIFARVFRRILLAEKQQKPRAAAGHGRHYIVFDLFGCGAVQQYVPYPIRLLFDPLVHAHRGGVDRRGPEPAQRQN